MKLKGGYSVSLQGRPAGTVETLPEPEVLCLPLQSRRFSFSEICVADGVRVHAGQALARDPLNYSVPLLAPREGTVRLGGAEGHIVLEDVEKTPEEPYHPGEEPEHVPRGMGSAGMQRYKLLTLGAWQFLSDAHTGELPDPFGTPQAVIVSTVHMEPFLARGDVQIRNRLSSFTRGLEHLQSLLEYQPIYLVIPDIESEFAAKVRETLRGYAWVKAVQIAPRYGLDNFAVLARHLGLEQDAEQPVWALGVAGVLAADRALTLSHPSTVRIVAIGGPAVESPVHLKAMPGYPLEAILKGRVSGGEVRVINGGALTGGAITCGCLSESSLGLDSECAGLTVLTEQTEREFLGFLRPGWDRPSYGNCFLSVLRPGLLEPMTTALRGERRPCISCGYCEEVCPARIMPHLIHKYLYQDALEAAEEARVDLCVHCGLCSFVCPSKIELSKELADAQGTIRAELHPEEVSA